MGPLAHAHLRGQGHHPGGQSDAKKHVKRNSGAGLAGSQDAAYRTHEERKARKEGHGRLVDRSIRRDIRTEVPAAGDFYVVLGVPLIKQSPELIVLHGGHRREHAYAHRGSNERNERGRRPQGAQ